MGRIVLQMEDDDIIKLKRAVLAEKGSLMKQSEFCIEALKDAIDRREKAIAL